MQNALLEHSAILLTFIKLPFVFKTFVLSIFEWPLRTGFTVVSILFYDRYHQHWLADRGYDYDNDYSMLVHFELITYLGLSKYLMKEECSILSDVYFFYGRYHQHWLASRQRL